MPRRSRPWPMPALAAPVLAAALAAGQAQGGAEPWDTPYDRYFEAPDAEVINRRDSDGAETRTVTLPSGVIVQQRRGADGAVTTLTTDLGGPVLCMHGIYIELQAALEGCRNLRYPRAARRLAVAIDRINWFISENWVEPIAVSEVAKWGDDHKAALRARPELFGAEGDLCRSDDIKALLEDLQNTTDAEFDSGLDTLLAVPRLPAMAPCR